MASGWITTLVLVHSVRELLSLRSPSQLSPGNVVQQRYLLPQLTASIQAQKSPQIHQRGLLAIERPGPSPYAYASRSFRRAASHETLGFARRFRVLWMSKSPGTGREDRIQEYGNRCRPSFHSMLWRREGLTDNIRLSNFSRHRRSHPPM